MVTSPESADLAPTPVDRGPVLDQSDSADGWDQAGIEADSRSWSRAWRGRRSAADESDWAWVEEWRRGGEPVPWGPGLALLAFTALLVATAVYVLAAGLAGTPIIAVAVNIIVAGGVAPAIWLSRGLPVLRWISAGVALGVLLAWVGVLIFLL